MGLLTSLLTLPITGPPRAAMWVVEQIVSAAEEELYDESRIVRELHDANSAVDAGLITEREYEQLEKQLLERLAVARERKRWIGDET